MKKIIALTLLLCSLVSIMTVSVAAYLGEAAEVVASDITVIKTALKGKKICFSDADIKSALALANFDTLTVTSIPKSTEGTLLLAGRRVSEGKSIKRKNIASLVFIPASASVEEARFKITVDGYCGGAEIECILKFIDKVNYAPKCDDEESVSTLKTQEEICTHGKMSAQDPEGDEIEYIVVKYPQSGVLKVSSDDGKFVYTPTDGFVGSDSFLYVARDEYGNYSKPQTVKISVTKRMSSVEYADMSGAKEYNAAVALSAMGIMDGRLVGDKRYFEPEETVTRAEFVAMAMKSLGLRADSTLSSSFFDDDADIPSPLVGYIATAQRAGFINGDFDNGMLVFKPNDAITHYDAAMVMAAILGTDDDGEEGAFADGEDIPKKARASIKAMQTLGIFDEESSVDYAGEISRANAAEYLYRMINAK